MMIGGGGGGCGRGERRKEKVRMPLLWSDQLEI